MSNTNESISWENVIKKEARGAVDDSDFGDVQGFDGDTLWFNASESDLAGWMRDTAPDYDEYTRYKQSEEVLPDVETRIPLIEERLNVSKRTSTSEVTIAKEPVTETKTVEVPVTQTRTVSDTVTSEKIDVSGSKEEER